MVVAGRRRALVRPRRRGMQRGRSRRRRRGACIVHSRRPLRQRATNARRSCRENGRIGVTPRSARVRIARGHGRRPLRGRGERGAVPRTASGSDTLARHASNPGRDSGDRDRLVAPTAGPVGAGSRGVAGDWRHRCRAGRRCCVGRDDSPRPPVVRGEAAGFTADRASARARAAGPRMAAGTARRPDAGHGIRSRAAGARQSRHAASRRSGRRAAAHS